MNCPQCGTENPEGAIFCMNCGGKMALSCPRCGTELPLQARFCTACGTSLDTAPPEPAPTPAAAPSTPEIIADRLKRLVPQQYAERLLATRGQVSAERRTVTILFSDVKDSTAMADSLDPEEVLDVMNGAFDVLIEPVYRHEGTLARLMGDAVLAFFGAPVAHEDDPERAVRVALEIIDGAERYAERLERERGLSGFNVRVGIHTGLVVAGEVGTDLRVEYTAMGDATNLAARLEQAAPPGGILISHDTYRHVRGVFDVSAQPPLAVKGKTEPVKTYLVKRARPRAFRKPLRGVEGVETRLVGREAELKHLQDAFHTVMEDGELQVVTVTGDAGVGKSRLLHEFDIWSELLPEPFFYLKGRAVHETLHVPYGLIRDLISVHLQILDSDPSYHVRDKLERGIAEALGPGDQSQRIAHTIGRLLGFELGDSRHLAGLVDNAQEFHRLALDALTSYFRGLATQSPVLILLEDLQWADDSSLDALNHLAQALSAESVMVACTARPTLFDRRPHWGEGQPFHSRLALEPLSRWDSRRLVAEILKKAERVPVALRDLLVAESEGNPFFIEELTRMLVEDGVIVPGEVRWRLEPSRLADIRVPPTLTGLLQARVDRLRSEERTVLQQASVVGRLFWDEAVARIQAQAGVEGEAAEVTDRLATLRSREMIYQRETSAFADAQEYIFQHALLREITYQGVLKRVRRVYHGLVADWLLERAGDRAGEYAGLIAEHLALAGRSQQAVEYLLRAGDLARGLYAHQEAIRAYERALDLLKEMGDDERAARTLMTLGLTYHTAFDFRRAREAHEEAFALWQRAASAPQASPPPPAPHALRQHFPEPSTLDPGLATESYAVILIEQLFSGLARYTPELSIVPDVARSWEVLDGGRRYVFHLRDDVLWSDGVPVTAQDFAFAWRRILDPALKSQVASSLYDIRGAQTLQEGQGGDLGVRAVDETTLVVELEQPTGYFLHLVATAGARPVPRHIVEARGASWADPPGLVSNGPFTLASWEPGKAMVLERNQRYHGPTSGNVQQVRLALVGVVQPSLEIEAYEAGLVDVLVLSGEDRELADRALRRHAKEHVMLPDGFTHFLSLDTAHPPFDDRRVRQAFAHALDREALQRIGSALRGLPALGGLVPPGMVGHVPGIALPYDPARGQELLAEAGYPGGAGFPTVEMLSFPNTPGIWDHVVAQWRDNLGVEVRWHSLPWAEHLKRIHDSPPPIFLMGSSADYPDPDGYLRLAVERHSAWRHEKFLEAIGQARRTVDQEARMQLYAQAQRVLAEEVPLLLLRYGQKDLLLKPWVKRYQMSTLFSMFWKDVILEPHEGYGDGASQVGKPQG